MLAYNIDEVSDYEQNSYYICHKCMDDTKISFFICVLCRPSMTSTVYSNKDRYGENEKH
jgi:hypothetical protein